jgi:hypothetical protein
VIKRKEGEVYIAAKQNWERERTAREFVTSDA